MVTTKIKSKKPGKKLEQLVKNHVIRREGERQRIEVGDEGFRYVSSFL